ncbi:MAG: GNAT family N-acetyltransferase [Ardenticatenia bacterium]|nr:GNAT family N-acetyltransferase [Ardenticatenia bacterium]
MVLEGESVGRGTLKWHSAYGPFREAGIPEINDLWVRREHRGLGLGRRIIAHIEGLARAAGARRSASASACTPTTGRRSACT